jgi:hypothetical protein
MIRIVVYQQNEGNNQENDEHKECVVLADKYPEVTHGGLDRRCEI